MIRLRTGAISLFASLAFACSSAEAPVGENGGPCYPNDTCNAELSCEEGLCAPAEPISDGGVAPDSGTADGGTSDTGTTDAGGTDGGAGDGGPDDATSGDSGGTADSGAPDGGGPADTGETDTGTSDGSTGDTGATDGGQNDAAVGDSGLGDSGESDAGSDPCQNVSCALAPAPTCINNTTQRTYSAPGQCQAGICQFGYNDQVCADACVQGACVVLTCNAATCDTPPGDVCADANNLTMYADFGTCNGSNCDYSSADWLCSGGCAGGGCAPGSWRLVELDPGRAFKTAVAFDAADQPHVFAITDPGMVAYWNTPMGWTSQLFDPNLYGIVDIRTASDASGGVHVVYHEAANTNVRYAYKPYGGASFAVEFVASTGDVYPLDLALDSQGIPSVLYTDTTTFTFFVARRTAPGQWTVTHSMPGHTGNSGSRGQLVFDENDVPIVALTIFSFNNSTQTRTLNSRLSTGDGLGGFNSVTLSDDVVSGLAYNRSTTELHLLMTDTDTGIDVRRRDALGSWTSEIVAATSDAFQGVMAMDTNGALHLTWHHHPQNFGVMYATNATGSWVTQPVHWEYYGYEGRRLGIAVDSQARPYVSAVRDIGEELRLATPWP